MRRFVLMLFIGAIGSTLLPTSRVLAFEPLPIESSHRAGSQWNSADESIDLQPHAQASTARSRPPLAKRVRPAAKQTDFEYATEDDPLPLQRPTPPYARPQPLSKDRVRLAKGEPQSTPFADDPPQTMKKGKLNVMPDNEQVDRFAPPPTPGRAPSAGGRVNSTFSEDLGDGSNSCGCGGGCDSCDSCGGGCDDCCDECCCICECAHNRLYVRGEYGLWWSKGDHMVPLITSSPAGTPAAQAGILGQADTVILFGNENVNNDLRSGLRLTAGWWLDDCRCTALEGTFLGLENNSTDFRAIGTDGSPILARPFFNAQTTVNAAQLISFPNFSTAGFVNVAAENQFWTGTLTLRKLMSDCCDDRLDFLAGYRYARLEDSLLINDSLTAAAGNPGGLQPGTVVSGFDSFDTENDFNGGEFGLMYESHRQRLSIRLLGKVALGNVHQRVNINGSTTVVDPQGGSLTTPGGLLTQPAPSNIGDFNRNRFGVMPEAGVTLSYCFTPRLTGSVGYSFLYMSNVVRAGSEVDPSLNPSLINPPLVGPVAPVFSWNEAGYWAQGVNFGMEYKF